MATTKRTARTTQSKAKQSTEAGLFSTMTESSVDASGSAQVWQMATNHQNALLIIAAGMATGPSGFGGKYYADTLSIMPGWVPLFRKGLPAALIEQVTHEAPHLKPCALTYDMSSVSGKCRFMSKDGVVRDAEFPQDLDADDVALLVRAPLANSVLTGVSFKTKEDQGAFESGASTVGNVDLSGITFRSDRTLFTESYGLVWAESIGEDVFDPSPASAQAIGGILAMLYHGASRSQAAIAALRSAFNHSTAQDSELLARDSVLRGLPFWLDGKTAAEPGDVPARLFWGVVDAVIQARASGSPLKPIDEALRFLEEQLTAMGDQAYRPRLERLLQDMRRSVGFADSTVTELLERHKGSLSRPLMLFCLRESCEDLLAFSHPLLSDAEFVLATVLFGAREGWMALPRGLKRPHALARAVSHRMAESEHRKNGSGVSLGPPPTRPVPIRELFEHGEQEWSKAQVEAALALAREYKWNDCLQTRINLGKGEYRLLVESGGIQLLLDGEVKNVSTQVDEPKFMQKIATVSLAEASEAVVRAGLKSKA